MTRLPVPAERTVTCFSGRVRDTDSFTRAVADWLGRAVTYQLVSQREGVPRPFDLLTLEVPVSSAVLHRRGFLWAPLPEPTIVADVRSAVLTRELTRRAQQALARGDTPLGAVFAPRAVRRHTHAVTRTSVTDRLGRQSMRVHATLTVSGRPVANVEEIVYAQLLDKGREQRGRCA